jgi:hypothetical protein
VTVYEHDSHGSGPGVITPDGCAVELYSMLPPGPDPEIVHAAVAPPPSSILELGAGAGRVTHPLSATAEYQAGDRVWTHSFTTALVDDEDLAADLAATRLALDAFLTEDRTWLRAAPRA